MCGMSWRIGGSEGIISPSSQPSPHWGEGDCRGDDKKDTRENAGVNGKGTT